MSQQSYSTGNTYYATIRDESKLIEASRGSATLATLLGPGWKSAASRWGRAQLLAHRVVCSRPAPKLSFLEPWLQDARAAHECLGRLIEGPGSIDALQHSSETQIIHRHQPDSLGYVWAAFLPFVRAPTAVAEDVQPVERPRRERKVPERLVSGVTFDQGDLEMSQSHSETSESGSSFSSVGFMDKHPLSPSEDASIRLASCFVRCVLNYGQRVDKREPFVEFRDERRRHSFALIQFKTVEAVDDGGMHVLTSGGEKYHQVALVEGKRNLPSVTNGVADISDELLGQMVGGALALQGIPGRLKSGAARADFVTILVATHWVKLFHFHISADYKRSYGDLAGRPDQGILDGTLRVNSTEWLDLKKGTHRSVFASHILALVAWTNDLLA